MLLSLKKYFISDLYNFMQQNYFILHSKLDAKIYFQLQITYRFNTKFRLPPHDVFKFLITYCYNFKYLH